MTQACVELPVWIWRTSRNISFKAKIESSIFHGGRQSGANESQQECNAVWLILGSLSVWFYWEKWDDDRWISALTAGVEGRVIVAEMWRVFSVSRHVRRGQSIRAFIWTLQTHRLCRFVTQSGSVLTGVAGVTPVSVLFHCWGCHGWCCGGWCWGGKHWVGGGGGVVSGVNVSWWSEFRKLFSLRVAQSAEDKKQHWTHQTQFANNSQCLFRKQSLSCLIFTVWDVCFTHMNNDNNSCPYFLLHTAGLFIKSQRFGSVRPLNIWAASEISLTDEHFEITSNICITIQVSQEKKASE